MKNVFPRGAALNANVGDEARNGESESWPVWLVSVHETAPSTVCCTVFLFRWAARERKDESLSHLERERAGEARTALLRGVEVDVVARLGLGPQT